MQIEQQRFLDLIGKQNTRFVIPVFQRVYSWDARQCEELWEDILNAGRKPEDLLNGSETDPHFMGMLLYSTDVESWHGALQLDIIDGQQRMTTLSLLLCALARFLDESNGSVGGFTPSDMFDRFLRIGDGVEATGKLTLSFMDRDTLYALVGTGVMPAEPAGRLIDNLELFYAKMQQPDFDVEQLWRGLERLEIASVQLDHDDNPQLVFESLNSKGMALSTADRIRNFIVVSDEASGDDESGVFERCWLPLEQFVAENLPGLDVTAVVQAWLAGKYRSIRIFDKAQVYGIFKNCLRGEFSNDVEALLATVSDYAKKLANNEGLRTKELANAERWIAGKPKELISEYKMFGD